MRRTLPRLLVLALMTVSGVVALAPSASAATGTIQGTVTGLTTGAPANAWVFVYSGTPATDVFTDPCDDESCVGADQTDSSGAFAVSGLAVGSYKVFVQSDDAGTYSRWYGGKGDTYAAATSVAAPNGGHTDIAVQLTVKGGISGTVSDDTGVRSGVTVTAFRVNGDGTQNPAGTNTTTDSTGHYLIPSLVAGSYRLFASDPSHVGLWNGGASSFADADDVVVADGGETTGVGFALARYGSVSGTVTDAASAPVSGATVEAHRVDGSADGGIARTTSSGADGSYTLGTLPPGTYRVRAVPTGLANGPAWNGNAASFATAVNITVANGGAVTGTDIHLPAAPGGISGTVTPVLPGTTVTASPYGAPGDPVTVPVGSDGTYQLAVPAGNYLLAINPPASRPDYPTSWVYRRCNFGACTWVTLTAPASAFDNYDPVHVDAGVVTSGVTATLPKVPVLAGRVTDTTGSPVANASVQLWLRTRIDPFSTSDHTAWNLYGENACAGDYYADPAPCLTTTTDADGRYVVHPPTWPSDYYGDGEDYLLLVVPEALHRPQWVGAPSPADLPDSWPSPEDMDHGEWSSVPGYGNAPEQLTLDQVLTGAGRLAGTVSVSGGGPATGVAVRVHSNLDDGSPLAGRDYRTTTADDGTWSVGHLPAGGYSVHFGEGSDHYVPQAYDGGAGLVITASQNRTGIDATLEEGGRVTGTITGDPGTGAVPLVGTTVHVYAPAGAEVASATTVAGGTYALTLPVGTYRIQVTPAAGTPYAARWYGAGATSQATAADVVVTLGGSMTVDAQLNYVPADPPPVSTIPSIKLSTTQVVAGQKVAITGVLRTSGGQAVAGAPLTLQARVGTGAFATAARATTSASGTASVSVAPAAGTTYRWVYAGDPGHLASTSGTAIVRVAFAVTGKALRTTLGHRATAKVWGTVAPARAGTTVVLQRLVKGTWRTLRIRTTVAMQRLPGATKASLGYVLRFKEPKGTYTFRVVAPATGTNLLGASGSVRIKFT